MGADAGLEQQLDAESEWIAEQGGTPEAEAGLAALVERRRPHFRACG
jgi:hypothetical protein